MKVVHLIGGGDVGGAKTHVLALINEMSKDINVKLISFREGPFSEEARTLGINITVIHTGNIFKDIRQAKRLIKLEKYDLIHCHGAKGNLVGYLCKRSLKLPTITTVHSDYKLDYLHSKIKALTYGNINSYVLRKLDSQVAVTNTFRQMLIDRKYNANRVYTIHNGINPVIKKSTITKRDFLDQYKLPISDNSTIICVVARLTAVKSISTIIEAMVEVKNSFNNSKLIIAGNGDLEKKLRELVKKLNLEDTVYFLGWSEDINDLFSISDISVLSSLSESFPYSLLEGALNKTATISTDVGGIPDLIINNKTGLLFKPKDVDQLSKHILELCSNKEKRIVLANNLYDLTTTKFTLEIMAKNQIEIYKDITSWIKNGKRCYDIILSGYYGFMNIGDDASLYSIINNFSDVEENIRILILSRNPVETSLMNGVDSISRTNIFKLIKTMRSSKLFIYGGGTLIQESTSTRSLFYYLGTMYIAKLLGLKTMLYGNGVKQITKKHNVLLTKFVLNKIDLITVREKSSYDELVKLKVTKPRIEITADSAVSTNPCNKEEVIEIFTNEKIPLNKKYLGISLREWEGYEKEFIPEIAKYADYMSKTHDFIPIFIPMQRKYVDDVIVCESVRKLMSNESYILSKYYNTNQIMGVIGEMNLVLGMRLHSLIFAACSSVNLIALSYEPKVEAFMNYINLKALVITDISTISYNGLIEKSIYAINNEIKIKKELDLQADVLRNKAIKNATLALDLMNQKEN